MNYLFSIALAGEATKLVEEVANDSNVSEFINKAEVGGKGIRDVLGNLVG